MKVFVRCVQSKMYFSEAGTWTEKKWEGRDFQTTLHVLDDLRLRALSEDLEMVFSFGEAKFDIVIPIERRAPPTRFDDRENGCHAEKTAR